MWQGVAKAVAASMKGYYMSRALPKSIGWIGEPLMARKAQKYLTQRTSEVVAGLTDDPKLRALLVAQWGYYGSPPSRSSFYGAAPVFIILGITGHKSLGIVFVGGGIHLL